MAASQWQQLQTTEEGTQWYDATSGRYSSTQPLFDYGDNTYSAPGGQTAIRTAAPDGQDSRMLWNSSIGQYEQAVSDGGAWMAPRSMGQPGATNFNFSPEAKGGFEDYIVPAMMALGTMGIGSWAGGMAGATGGAGVGGWEAAMGLTDGGMSAMSSLGTGAAGSGMPWWEAAASGVEGYTPALGGAGVDAATYGAAGSQGGSLFQQALSAIRSTLGSDKGGTLGSLASLASIGSGLYGMYKANQMEGLSADLAKGADPWGTSGGRSMAIDQLKGLLTNPNSIFDMPGYKAGQQAVERAMAAQGYTGSGNALVALSKYGGDFYNQALQNLTGLAGANVNPGQGANIALTGQVNANDLASKSLASLGYGAQRANRDPMMDLIMSRLGVMPS